MVVTLQGAISKHVNMGLQVQNAHGMLDNVGTQDSAVLAKHHNVLIGSGKIEPWAHETCKLLCPLWKG